MDQQQFYILKRTGTLTDTLLAFGAATVIEQFVQKHDENARVTMRDAGGYFLVEVSVPVQEAWLDATELFETVGVYFLSSSKMPVPDDLVGMQSRDVDKTWDRFRHYIEQHKQLREAKMAGDEIEQTLADSKPSLEFSVITYLGDYRMQAQNIHNGLVEQWRRSGEAWLALNLRTLLALFATPTADWNEIAAHWKKATKATDFADQVTASQLFNPHMGKGQNRAKADKLTMGNEKLFWLLEYLKAVGLWAATAPTKASGSDLRKTYVLSPTELDMQYHRRVFASFRDQLRNEGPVKQDIVASLLYAEVLLEQSVEQELSDLFGGGGITNLVSGMNVATYQLLSQNSYTLMNLSFLGLPDWMPEIRTSDDAEMYIELLQEHRERIRSLDEEKSEGYALLQLYRDFVSGNYLAPFFEFLAGYGGYLISELDRSHFYVKPFCETNLRSLLMMIDNKLTPIVEDEGFRNVASAIRKSTVSVTYTPKEHRRYELRYGLGQELMRKSQYSDDFMQALTEFMQSYNDETMRVHERTRGKMRRKLITTGDIESIVRLIDEYDAKTVCNLLVAFGYARDPKEKSEDEGTELEENTGEEPE